jgi:hypothetical protein
MTATSRSDWLALLHQLPTKPPYLRVKIWRRLQAIGAVPLKNAVHVLPKSEANEATLLELLNEIIGSGGEAILLDAQLLAGQNDGDVRALFDAARDADYDEIAQIARRLLDTGPASGTTSSARMDARKPRRRSWNSTGSATSIPTSAGRNRLRRTSRSTCKAEPGLRAAASMSTGSPAPG